MCFAGFLWGHRVSACGRRACVLARCWGHWPGSRCSQHQVASGWGAAAKSPFWTRGALLTAVLVLPATPQLCVAREQWFPSFPAGLRGQGATHGGGQNGGSWSPSLSPWACQLQKVVLLGGFLALSAALPGTAGRGPRPRVGALPSALPGLPAPSPWRPHSLGLGFLGKLLQTRQALTTRWSQPGCLSACPCLQD